MGDVGKEIPPGYFLFGQFLVSLGQFTGPHPQVVNGHLVVFTQAATDLTNHCQGHTAAVLEDLVEGLFVYFQADEGCQCFDGGRARRIVDERHFTEEIARCKLFEQARLDVVENFGDFHFPFQDQVESIFKCVFMAKNCPDGIIH